MKEILEKLKEADRLLFTRALKLTGKGESNTREQVLRDELLRITAYIEDEIWED